MAAADQVVEVGRALFIKKCFLSPHIKVGHQVAEAFHDLCREVHAARRKNKTSLLDRSHDLLSFGFLILSKNICFQIFNIRFLNVFCQGAGEQGEQGGDPHLPQVGSRVV